MNRRGRPPYPDVLTPRQWQVLALLREGLSNEQIALRLGISLDGVKFHVSEILGKLGVGSRNEAAQWDGEQREFAPSACVAGMRRSSASGPTRSWRGLSARVRRDRTAINSRGLRPYIARPRCAAHGHRLRMASRRTTNYELPTTN